MISVPDLINGLFELCGSVFIILNIRQVLKDKEVKGVYWPAMMFFTVWGYWNIFYYPHLNQWLSFLGGLAIAACNSVYVFLLIYYSRRKQ